jgi:hypothetical protein
MILTEKCPGCDGQMFAGDDTCENCQERGSARKSDPDECNCESCRYDNLKEELSNEHRLYEEANTDYTIAKMERDNARYERDTARAALADAKEEAAAAWDAYSDEHAEAEAAYARGLNANADLAEDMRTVLLDTLGRIKKMRTGMHYGTCAIFPRELPCRPFVLETVPVMSQPGRCDCGAVEWAASVDKALTGQ